MNKKQKKIFFFKCSSARGRHPIRAPSGHKSALLFKFKALCNASLMCVLSQKVNISLSTLSAGNFHYGASEEPACFLFEHDRQPGDRASLFFGLISPRPWHDTCPCFQGRQERDDAYQSTSSRSKLEGGGWTSLIKQKRE